MKPLRLTDAEPIFIAYRAEGGSEYQVRVETLAQAHGLRFLCPLCFERNGGAAGTHEIVCWFEGKVDDEVSPGPGRWKPAGKDFTDLSFVPGRNPKRSIKNLSGCKWHGFLTDGLLTECPPKKKHR